MIEASLAALPRGKRRRRVMLRKLTLRLTVKDGERAFLLRNGRFGRVLGPGRHRLFDPLGGFVAELHRVVRTEYPAERFAVLKAARPDLAAEMFEAVETKADETAIVSLDGRPSFLMGPWQTRVFWKVVTRSRSSASISRMTSRSRRIISRWSRASATRSWPKP
jgi:hypothetical protein